MGCFVIRREVKQLPLSGFEAGHQRNRGSFLGRGKTSFSFPKLPISALGSIKTLTQSLPPAVVGGGCHPIPSRG